MTYSSSRYATSSSPACNSEAALSRPSCWPSEKGAVARASPCSHVPLGVHRGSSRMRPTSSKQKAARRTSAQTVEGRGPPGVACAGNSAQHHVVGATAIQGHDHHVRVRLQKLCANVPPRHPCLSGRPRCVDTDERLRQRSRPMFSLTSWTRAGERHLPWQCPSRRHPFLQRCQPCMSNGNRYSRGNTSLGQQGRRDTPRA